MTYTSAHGTVVEYFTNDFQAYVWYPGKNRVLKGAWITTPPVANLGPLLCFDGELRGYHPTTGQIRSGWDCAPLSSYLQTVRQEVGGDPFKLKAQNLPFILNKAKTTLDLLAEKSKAALTKTTLKPNAAASTIYKTSKSTGSAKKAARPSSNDVSTWTCDEILSNQNASKLHKKLAAGIYFRGKYMGKTCMKPDYTRALEIALEIGEQATYDAYVKDLQYRAQAGHPSAVSALRKLGISY